MRDAPHTPDPDEALVERVARAIFRDMWRLTKSPEEADAMFGLNGWWGRDTEHANSHARAALAELSKPLSEGGWRLTQFVTVRSRPFEFDEEPAHTWEIPHDE